MKSYCVKQRKQTECVAGSEQYKKIKNGRLMMSCKCAECGITKTRFVKSKVSSMGKGVGESINKKVGDNIPGFQQAQDIAKIFLPDKKLFDKYWSGDIAKGAFNTKTGLFSRQFWDPLKGLSKKEDDKKQARNVGNCNRIEWDPKIKKYVNKYC